MIIIQYGGNFCGPKVRSVEVPISLRHYVLRNQRSVENLPRDKLGLRDFSGVQQGIRSATERSANIESDYKFPRKAGVWGAGHIHSGGQGRVVVDRVRTRSPTRDFERFLGVRQTFPLQDGGGSSKLESPPHIEVDPIKKEQTVPINTILVFCGFVFDPRPTSHTMSRNSTISPSPEICPPDSLSLPHGKECESPTAPQDRRTPTPKLSKRLEEDEEARERAPMRPGRLNTDARGRERPYVELTDGFTREVALGPVGETMEGPCLEAVDEPTLEVVEGPSREAVNPFRPAEVTMKRKRKEERIAELETEIREMRGFYEGVAEGKARDIRAIENRLKLTEGLLATRSAELSGKHLLIHDRPPI